MKFVFIGGGKSDLVNGVYSEVTRNIAELLRDKVLLLVLSASKSEFHLLWEDAVRAEYGILIKEIKVLNDYSLSKENMNKIIDADVYFFSGGLPDVSLDLLKVGGLFDIFKKQNKLFIGISAGALSFSKDCLITKDEDYAKTKIIEGFGFVDFCTDVHYCSSLERDKELLFLSNKRKIYALSNKSSIIFDSNNEKIVSFGEVVIFSNGVRSFLDHNSNSN